MQFDYLFLTPQWLKEYHTKYPHGMSVLENIIEWVNQVNKLIDWANMSPEKMEQILEEWNENGKLNYVINEALKTGLNDININVKDFSSLNSGNWSVPIQAAIDLAYSLNGGTVLLPTGVYNYSSDIHVKESVLLKGSKKSVLNCTVNSGARIILYHDSSVTDIEFSLPIDYNHSLFYFDNRYLTAITRKDKRGINQGKVVVAKNKIYKPDPGTNFKTRSETPEMVAFDFYAAPQPEYTILSGFWNVVVKENNIFGIPLVIKIKTDTTGWVNGCVFERNVADYFETFISVQRSPETKGIDGNNIRFNDLQTREAVTKDVFEDISARPYESNYIHNNHIWDMLTFTQARLGNMHNVNPSSGYLINKERYTWILAPNRYYLLGRFNSFSSSVHHVALEFTRPNRLKSEIIISGLSGGSVQRTHYGHDRSVNNFEFYTKTLANGQTELYVKVPSEIEVNMFFESMRSFVPSPIVYYTTVSDVTILTNISDAGPGSNITSNIFDHTSNLIQFPMGVSYTPVPNTNSNIATAPEGRGGTLITYKMVESGSTGYSWQEYKIFNTKVFYRRIAPTTTSWGEWTKIF